jgi:hypothetical protein
MLDWLGRLLYDLFVAGFTYYALLLVYRLISAAVAEGIRRARPEPTWLEQLADELQRAKKEGE